MNGPGKILVLGTVFFVFLGLLIGQAAFAEEAKVAFGVAWYDVGKAALEGLDGVRKVKKGWRGFTEANTVWYDPAVITVEEMENALKEAGTYRKTFGDWARERLGAWIRIMWNEIVEENRNWRVSSRAPFGPDRSADAPGRLAGDECRIIGMHSRVREVRKQETIYSQGDADSSIYMLYDGAVNLTKITPRGDRLITDIVGRGTMFGGTADGAIQRRNESAVVLDDGLLCAVSREGFSRIAETVPGLAMKMKGLLEERRCRREDRLVNLLFCTVEKRFARTLLNLIGDFGSLHDGGYLLNITLTHQTYADLVASSRETITMVLGRLRKAGVIDYEGRNIIIRSVDKLNRIARWG